MKLIFSLFLSSTQSHHVDFQVPPLESVRMLIAHSGECLTFPREELNAQV